jgi:hypothetical protein
MFLPLSSAISTLLSASQWWCDIFLFFRFALFSSPFAALLDLGRSPFHLLFLNSRN